MTHMGLVERVLDADDQFEISVTDFQRKRPARCTIIQKCHQHHDSHMTQIYVT